MWNHDSFSELSKDENIPPKTGETSRPVIAVTEHTSDYARRRNFILRATAGVALATMSAHASSAQRYSPNNTDSAGLSKTVQDQMDRAAISELIQRERAARDAGQWAEMAACYHPGSSIEVSWFKGDGAAFVELSKKNLSQSRVSLHQLSPSVVKLNNDRAIAETPTQLVAFVPVDGVDVCLNAYVRLMWRVQMLGDRWLIAGLRMIYIRDMLTPVNPGRVPVIDEAEASRYRHSYRYLSYVLARTVHPVQDDLPGVDRPEMVAALRAGEAAWLALSSKNSKK
ncbi:nuclear transport factor 2 family protein [Glaciimonas sp. PAMC28666]|uniref:nuclear transport factor 2 family protein n=1 Tax=Glaciimonas sp. PAMC28666 TaxID=2807626 RepID=UPI0019659586|nr:nuclear transport factor 2 family protein [Glaciimonas sp. PAMC28666]QRX81745.1 nuclear transport factor 2 family protein [Glaciimonas sp. PAMC28666]